MVVVVWLLLLLVLLEATLGRGHGCGSVAGEFHGWVGGRNGGWEMLSSAVVKALCRRCRARVRVQAGRSHLWTLRGKVRLDVIVIMAILLFKCPLSLLCPRILIRRQLSCLLLILTRTPKCKRVRNESRIVIARVSAPVTAERSNSGTSTGTAVGEGGGPLIVLVVHWEDIIGIDGVAGGVMTVRSSSVPASTALLADKDRDDKHQDHRTSGRNTGNSSHGESSCARGCIGGGGGGDSWGCV